MGGGSVGLCRGWTKTGAQCTQKAMIGSNFCHWHQHQVNYVASGEVWPVDSAPRKESTILGVIKILAAIALALAALWCMGVAIWLVVELIAWLT